MTTEVSCKCKNWKDWSEQIFNAQVQHTLRTGVEYTGEMWTHCPWCGCPLIKRPRMVKSLRNRTINASHHMTE
jgi:hypothetical protein